MAWNNHEVDMPLESLRVYAKAQEIAATTYTATQGWTPFDRDTLGKQLIRSADSIVSNIAEGYGRSGIGDQLQHLLIADGSVQECKAQIQLAVKRNLISEEVAADLLKLLRGLSMGLMAYGASILDSHPEYTGRARAIIERRNAWLWRRNKGKR
jgi:four helix bundle protein